MLSFHPGLPFASHTAANYLFTSFYRILSPIVCKSGKTCTAADIRLSPGGCYFESSTNHQPTKTKNMSTVQTLLKELEQEALTTRKMLERVPSEKFDWQPHRKSMTLQRLATHVAELTTWVEMAVTTDELDFEKNAYAPEVVHDSAGLMEYFERSLARGRESLAKTSEDTLSQAWTLRNGDQVYLETSKGEMVRTAYCQIVHHRAQLGVFLRLLDIPIPGSYGPSADENFM